MLTVWKGTSAPLTLIERRTCTTVPEKPHMGNERVPFMKTTTRCWERRASISWRRAGATLPTPPPARAASEGWRLRAAEAASEAGAARAKAAAGRARPLARAAAGFGIMLLVPIIVRALCCGVSGRVCVCVSVLARERGRRERDAGGTVVSL